MNHRISLMRRAAGVNGSGEQSKEWSIVRQVWSDVLFQSGAEVMRGGAEASVVKASIRIRARADVDNSMRAVYKGWTFDIQSVLPDKDPQFAFLVCEAVK